MENSGRWGEGELRTIPAATVPSEPQTFENMFKELLGFEHLNVACKKDDKGKVLTLSVSNQKLIYTAKFAQSQEVIAGGDAYHCSLNVINAKNLSEPAGVFSLDNFILWAFRGLGIV